MGPGLGALTAALVVLSLAFWPLEWRWPSRRGQPRWRPGLRTDLLYWFFTPLVTRALSRLAVVAALVALALAAGLRPDAATLRALAEGHGTFGRLPLAAQAALVVVAGDLVGYWSHRLFHGRRLWRFHAIHHSSTDVDWLSSVRLHPVNDAASRLLQVIPFLMLGVAPAVVAAYLPFLTLHALLLHANVRWTFGPLRYVISSPAFHRWHHTTQAEGLDKNFAGLLPLWDVLFGTFFMPQGRQPERFGILDGDVAPGLLGQLAYPFRRH